MKVISEQGPHINKPHASLTTSILLPLKNSKFVNYVLTVTTSRRRWSFEDLEVDQESVGSSKLVRGRLCIEGSGPEWYISSMLYSRDMPFWSGTLHMLLLSLDVDLDCVSGRSRSKDCNFLLSGCFKRTSVTEDLTCQFLNRVLCYTYLSSEMMTTSFCGS